MTESQLAAALTRLPTHDDFRAMLLVTQAVRADVADLHRAIAPLATREELSAARDELSAAMAQLATREELGATREELRALREDFEKFRKSSHESVELVAGHLAGISLKVDSLLAR